MDDRFVHRRLEVKAYLVKAKGGCIMGDNTRWQMGPPCLANSFWCAAFGIAAVLVAGPIAGRRRGVRVNPFLCLCV